MITEQAGPNPDNIEGTEDTVANVELPFHSVSTLKLVVLSLSTLGLYQLVWFYKNWKQIKKSSGVNVSPFWRSIFSPFFCFSFVEAVSEVSNKVKSPGSIHPGFVTTAYLFLLVLQRLPDPYWLLCFLSFIPLIPVARQIRLIHETLHPEKDTRIGWGAGSWAALVFGGLFTLLCVLGTFMPETRVLRASEIPASYHGTLVEAGVIETDDKIEYFYSNGLFSILEGGSIITGERLISYDSFSEEDYVSSVGYSDVEDYEVQYSESVLDDSILWVTSKQGIELALLVSPEEQRDREFVASFEKHLKTAGVGEALQVDAGKEDEVTDEGGVAPVDDEPESSRKSLMKEYPYLVIAIFVVVMIGSYFYDEAKWKRKPDEVLINMVQSGYPKRAINELKYLKKRGYDLSDYIYDVLPLLLCEGKMDRTVAALIFQQFYPEDDKLIKDYRASESLATCRGKVEVLYKKYGMGDDAGGEGRS